MEEKNYTKAIALKYSNTGARPIVKATGTGLLAQKIIKEATEKNIPVYEDEELIKYLNKENFLESMDEEIMPAVIGIMEFLNNIEEKC
jgi:flagellar biosynthesis protein